MRHGRTPYSASYRVNGDPTIAADLDEHGIGQCRAARTQVPAPEIVTCLTSNFARTAESAKLVLGEQLVRMRVIAGLGEIDYGSFEGQPFQDYAAWLSENGPCARPPGSAESQREAIGRMLHALRSVFDCPGPRLVVTHGLLVSVVLWARGGNANGPCDLLFFPEAPCASPLRIDDLELASLIDEVSACLPCDNWTQPSGVPGDPRHQLQVRAGSLPSAAGSQWAEAQVQVEGNSDA